MPIVRECFLIPLEVAHVLVEVVVPVVQGYHTCTGVGVCVCAPGQGYGVVVLGRGCVGSTGRRAGIHGRFGIIATGDGDSSSEREDEEKERADREAPHRSRRFEDLEVLVFVKTVLACNTDLRGGCQIAEAVS